MKYALKKVRKITGRDIATGKNKFIMSDLKTVTISGNSETVWADGQDGAHLVGFDVNKVANIAADNGAIDIGYLETQVGDKMVTVKNGSEVMISETLKVTSNSATTTYKASGLAGNEIKFVYAIDATGDPDREMAIAQGAQASESEFAYDPETKAITFSEGKFKDGDQVYVEYFPKFKEYGELTNDSTKFAETVAVYVDAWFTDICTKKDVPLQMILPAGKVSGEINYQMGDQAAVQSLNIESMTTCGEKALWRLYKYNMEDVSED